MTSPAAVHLDLVRWCTTCQDDVFFEQPDCFDNHGADCPERVCVQCGDALLVGFDLSEPVLAPRRAGRVA
ncbi:MAG: hypothetical protein ACRDWY_06340 [Actinomycetes bacterium]